MVYRLDNKVALVTGGGSGIGKAISQCFAQHKATVIVGDIRLEAAQAVAESIVEAGGSAIAVFQDVTLEDHWETVVDEVLASYGQLDIVVNNAGIGIHGSIEDASYEDWKKTQKINADGVFLGCRKAVRAMKTGGGSIINISSIEGIVGDANGAAYNASKGAVRLLTKSAALHCADSDYAIRVNSVHPGFIKTELFDNAIAAMPEAEAQAMLSKINSGVPLKRVGLPEEIAHACLFLASEESSYITGSELVVDGGFTAR